MEVARIVEAPAARVWELLTDTRTWPKWGPSVRAVDADRWIGPGSRGRVRTPLGVWLPFRITRFDPPVRWDWEVAGIPATGHRVEALGPSRCRVVFVLPALAWPYAAVCRIAARRIALMVEEDDGDGR